MSIMKKIVLVFGTRPEAIKMAPLVLEFKKYPDLFETIVCTTGQHKEMLTQVLRVFDISPDIDLDVMTPGQNLSEITSRILSAVSGVFDECKPDLVFVHGDTVTSMTVALAAFYHRISVAHVEAGLRTNNIYSPWPEEMNRQLTGRLASFHFAPTKVARQNLLAENVDPARVYVTGNTVIDALQAANRKIEASESAKNDLALLIHRNGYDLNRLENDRKLILITGHRRENFGEGFVEICQGLKLLARKYPFVDFVYPVHLNPNVQKPVFELLGESMDDNVFLIPPLEYIPFVYLMKKAYLILTDSGGIQEEAPGLGKPVLVMRNTTERPEALEAGTIRLVGADAHRIVASVSELLDKKCEYEKMTSAINPYGDGKASARIVSYTIDILHQSALLVTH